MANPLKAFVNVKRGEWTLALSMFLYFFLVITTFWILKPLKKTLFIGHYSETGFDLLGWWMTAAQAELWAKVLNMVVAFVAVTVFTLLSRRLFRQHLSYAFSAFFLAAFLLYTQVLNEPSGLIVWSFYLFGDLYSTLMVATFFAFLNDSVRPDDAKRLYGLIVLGGVSGGAFGSLGVAVWINDLTSAEWLWISFGIAVAIAVSAAVAGREAERFLPEAQARALSKPTSDVAGSRTEQPKANAAFEGAKLVFRSRYLLAIVGIVGLYEICSTVLDYQFSETIAHLLEGPAQRQQFATVFLLTNITAMVVQLFLTSFIMTRFGLRVALTVLPAAMLIGSLGFMAMPILWMGSLLNTFDNGFSYSINQSSKEALYTPTSRDEKYKAKAFIDMFVQRFAKALAVGVSLGIGALFTTAAPGGGTELDFGGLRWLSVFTVAIIVLWLFAVRYAGRKFRELTEDGERPRSTPLT
jgi:ATP:ADP antiporter, AAA family